MGNVLIAVGTAAAPFAEGGEVANVASKLEQVSNAANAASKSSVVGDAAIQTEQALAKTANAAAGAVGREGGIAAENAGGKYSNLPDPKNVGPGKDFTPATKRNMLQQNMDANGGVLKSDQSGTELVPSQKSQSGVTPEPNEAQVDHIDPKSNGGTNSPSNGQILSRQENRTKSNN